MTVRMNCTQWTIFLVDTAISSSRVTQEKLDQQEHPVAHTEQI